MGATLKSLACVLGGAFLMLLAGCGSKPQSETANSVLQSEPRPAAAAAPPSSQLNIKGPRSQAELDRIYGGAGSATVPGNGAIGAAPAPGAVYPEGTIVAEPSWEVKITREWRHIVVHHSGTPNGSMAAFDAAHKGRGWEGVGYHFVIGNGTGSGDGQVEATFRWYRQEQGAHAGVAEYNQHGIGICLVGDFEKGRPTPRQMASLRALVRFLQVKTGIPTYEVVGHGDIKSTECPGRWLDMAAFRASLGGNAISVPIHYTASPAAASRPVQMARSSADRGAALP